MEAVKTTGRTAILGAIATLVTYVINKYSPGTPEVVLGAILTLVMVFLDAAIHHSKMKLNGIVPF